MVFVFFFCMIIVVLTLHISLYSIFSPHKWLCASLLNYWNVRLILLYYSFLLFIVTLQFSPAYCITTSRDFITPSSECEYHYVFHNACVYTCFSNTYHANVTYSHTCWLPTFTLYPFSRPHYTELTLGLWTVLHTIPLTSN